MDRELTARGGFAAPRLGTSSPEIREIDAFGAPGPLDERLATASAVVALLYRMRNVLRLDGRGVAPSQEAHAYDDGDLVARARHLAQVLEHVRARRPIPLVILAFPAKSPNRAKTIGAAPDLGDLWGLMRLERLCAEIEGLYAPGARLVLCTDGHVFSDLVGVADVVVDRYRDGIQALIASFGLDRLSVYGLGEVYGTGTGWRRIRERLMADFGEAPEQQKLRLAEDAAARAQWSGIHRFVFEDTLALRPELSRNQAREAAKRDAYEVVRRSNAFSALVAERFPTALRLSIHPQPLGAAKIGVKLVAGGDRWATPWHNAPLVSARDESDVTLVRRELAEASGARLTSRMLRGHELPCFVAEGGA
jgi:pyoverdine/dityrosine biosynthesis protein Dit1